MTQNILYLRLTIGKKIRIFHWTTMMYYWSSMCIWKVGLFHIMKMRTCMSLSYYPCRKLYACIPTHSGMFFVSYLHIDTCRDPQSSTNSFLRNLFHHKFVTLQNFNCKKRYSVCFCIIIYYFLFCIMSQTTKTFFLSRNLLYY